MLLHDGMHVTETEAETLDVVNIPGGHTIQLVKNLAKVFPGNADAIVGEGRMQLPGSFRSGRSAAGTRHRT